MNWTPSDESLCQCGASAKMHAYSQSDVGLLDSLRSQPSQPRGGCSEFRPVLTCCEHSVDVHESRDPHQCGEEQCGCTGLLAAVYEGAKIHDLPRWDTRNLSAQELGLSLGLDPDESRSHPLDDIGLRAEDLTPDPQPTDPNPMTDVAYALIERNHGQSVARIRCGFGLTEGMLLCELLDTEGKIGRSIALGRLGLGLTFVTKAEAVELAKLMEQNDPIPNYMDAYRQRLASEAAAEARKAAAEAAADGDPAFDHPGGGPGRLMVFPIGNVPQEVVEQMMRHRPAPRPVPGVTHCFACKAELPDLALDGVDDLACPACHRNQSERLS